MANVNPFNPKLHHSTFNKMVNHVLKDRLHGTLLWCSVLIYTGLAGNIAPVDWRSAYKIVTHRIFLHLDFQIVIIQNLGCSSDFNSEPGRHRFCIIIVSIKYSVGTRSFIFFNVCDASHLCCYIICAGYKLPSAGQFIFHLVQVIPNLA